MQSETRQCQNCKQPFVIEPDDFAFYERIQVPPPTWCSDCRLMRRFSFRNEHAFYRRECNFCGKKVISAFSPDRTAEVYCAECWWSDKWDPMLQGKDFDYSLPFFTQYDALIAKVPHLNIWSFNLENGDYANYSANSKNVYLSISAIGSENVFYSTIVDKSFDCFDSYKVLDSQGIYEGANVVQGSASAYILNSRGCVDCKFVFDCANCQSCFMSANLRNKQYYFRNQQLTKDKYLKELSKIDFGSAKVQENLKKEFHVLSNGSLHKFANLINVVESTGDNSSNAKHAYTVFYSDEIENSKYCVRTSKSRDCYDVSGAVGSELCYETTVGGLQSFNSKCYTHGSDVNSVFYSHFCKNCSNIFGCYGLRSKQYCILNKQYAKEEYEELVPKIIAHMNEMPYVDQKGRVYRYGEFFPPELSPFAYNETVAQDYFPMTKEDALAEGYRWRDPDTKEYKVTKFPSDLPDHIRDVTDDILKETIGCAHGGECHHQCTTAFKIIPEELAFYRRMNLPLPRFCPNCRHYERLAQRNPLKLWHRKCQCAGAQSESGTYANTGTHAHHGMEHCPNEFETSYAPERLEVVYCEACYNAEVV